MESKARVQIQAEAISISYSINTVGKSMNPHILPYATGE